LKLKKNTLFFLSLLFACQFLCAQNYDSIYNKLSENVLRFESTIVVKKVDSILNRDKIPEIVKNDLKSLRVEALAQLSFFTPALKLANEILSNKNNVSEEAEVRICIQKALIFEIFEKSKETIAELNRLEGIYKTRAKDRYYGQYLFRKSSYYRILKPVEKSDSLALFYAVKAADFGDKNKYYDVGAIAKMLQSFFIDKKDYETRAHILQTALNDFKRLENKLSVSLVYTTLSNIYQKNKQLDVAKKFLDSALTEANKTDDLFLKSYAYKQRSSFLESINKTDSAFYYFKEFYKAEEAINLEKQNIEILEINFEKQIEKEKQAVLISNINLNQTKKTNRFLIIFITGIIFLLVIIFLLYKRINKKRKWINLQNDLLQKNIEQKELLLKELNHRVKNNLSLIISLIKFQSQEINEEFYKEKFKHLENRINTIAIAHEQFIYSDTKTAGEFYNLEEYLQKIAGLVNVSSRNVKYIQNIEAIQINIDTALPIGILINELISNSIEHAVTKDPLKINLQIEKKSNLIYITYTDSGTIFNKDSKEETLGLFIIESMVAQLNGKIEQQKSTFKIVLEHKN